MEWDALGPCWVIIVINYSEMYRTDPNVFLISKEDFCEYTL